MTINNKVCEECGLRYVQCHFCEKCDVCCDAASHASWDDPFMVVDDEEIYLAYEDECKMCGCERPCNDEGYCSRCWYIWTH